MISRSKLLVACTGSVASIKLSELLATLSATSLYDIQVVLTKAVILLRLSHVISLIQFLNRLKSTILFMLMRMNGIGRSEETLCFTSSSGSGPILYSLHLSQQIRWRRLHTAFVIIFYHLLWGVGISREICKENSRIQL